MNVLYGLAKPDEGEILLDGQVVDIEDPTDAIDRGISMVHQHFMLVPVLTVADNVLLGKEVMRGPIFLDKPEARRRIRELGERFGFDLDPDEKVGRPLGRLAAARRDPQGAVPRSPHPGARRAHGRADATGDRRDLRRPAPPRGGRPQHHLHQPQALRGARGRRPHHGHPSRQGRRQPHPQRDRRGRPRRADGRTRGAAHRRPRREPPGRTGAARAGPARARRPRRRDPSPA